MTTNDIMTTNAAPSDSNNSGEAEMKNEQPDTGARWAFRALTEPYPFRDEYEAERTVLAKLRRGVSFTALMAEVDLRASEEDPWPEDSGAAA